MSTPTTTAAPLILAPAGYPGTECDPAVRATRAAEWAADNAAKVAAGQWIVRDSAGQESLMDPAYFGRSFRPMRWMAADHIAAAKAISDRSLPVGGTVTLARDYHPRHGVKLRTITRLA